MKNYIFTKLLIQFFFSIQIFGQTPFIMNKKHYGNQFDEGSTFELADNGDIILVGNGTGSNGGNDIFIIRIDSLGNEIWKKYYGGSQSDNGYDIVSSGNDEYIIVGNSDSIDGDLNENKGFYDTWIFKINGLGNIIWQKSFGGSGWETSRGIDKTNDGGFIIVGETNSDDGDLLGVGIHKSYGRINGTDIWVIKISNSGSIVWQKCLGGTDYERGRDVYVSTNGSIYIAGYSDSYDGDLNYNYGLNDGWVVKMNANGDLLWQTPIGGLINDVLQGVTENAVGDIVVIGYTFSPNIQSALNHSSNDSDCFVAKLNSNTGSIQWVKLFGGSRHEEGFKITLCPDGDLLVLANTNSNDGDCKGNYYGNLPYWFPGSWVVKISNEGNIIWQKPLGCSTKTNQIEKAIFIDTKTFYCLINDDYKDENGIVWDGGISLTKFTTQHCPEQISFLTTSDNLTQNIGSYTEAKKTIKLSNTFGNDSKVNFSAGNSILLNPGVEINTGAVFKAEIKNCQ